MEEHEFYLTNEERVEGLTRDALLERLREMSPKGDIETLHCRADHLLLRFIDDTEVTEAFVALHRWYS